MITVLGLGFVGLTTALGFAEKGFRVYGVEADGRKAQALKAGNVPFHEPQLTEKLAEHAEAGRFSIAANLHDAIADSSVVFLCVGTPCAESGHVDLTYVLNAARECVAAMTDKKFRVLVVKSTVPPSTAEESVRPALEAAGKNVGTDLGLASNPEFLREGHAWNDFMYPDRVVVGVSDAKSEALLRELYAPFGAPLHVTNPTTAEFIKYLSNTLLSSMISFSNEMAMMASAIGGIDTKRAFRILHEDKRWFGTPANMATYVYPGCGYGGYCLPKDTEALIHKAAEKGYQAQVLRAVQNVNRDIKAHVIEAIKTRVPASKPVGILGLSFKPGSDDVRDASALHVIKGLEAAGYTDIIAHDPLATEAFKSAYPALNVRYVQSAQELLSKVDAAVLLTGWPEYTELAASRDKILDFRYIL